MFSRNQIKMAAVAIESRLQLQHLFKDISPMFDRTESENVVQSLKNNYGGKFNSLRSHDLLQCLQRRTDQRSYKKV